MILNSDLIYLRLCKAEVVIEALAHRDLALSFWMMRSPWWLFGMLSWLCWAMLGFSVCEPKKIYSVKEDVRFCVKTCNVHGKVYVEYLHPFYHSKEASHI